MRSLILAEGPGARIGWPARLLNALLAAGVLGGLLALAFSHLTYEWSWTRVYAYRAKFFEGWTVTVLLALTCLFTSSLLGLLFALARRSRLIVLRYGARLYVEVIRGTPLLVQILVSFYVVADAVGLQNRYVAGALALSLFSGAYMSEIFRAGIESVGRSQLESARAVGFTTWQTYRYVILPQALRQVLPPLAGQFASLIKDSSLLSVIAVNELTLNAQQVSSYTFTSFESYLPLAFGYLILTLPISLWSRRLERRSQYET